MKKNILEVVKGYIYSNSLTNRSLNISHEQIVNLFVHIQMDIFQLKSEKISAIKY